MRAIIFILVYMTIGGALAGSYYNYTKEKCGSTHPVSVGEMSAFIFSWHSYFVAAMFIDRENVSPSCEDGI